MNSKISIGDGGRRPGKCRKRVGKISTRVKIAADTGAERANRMTAGTAQGTVSVFKEAVGSAIRAAAGIAAKTAAGQTAAAISRKDADAAVDLAEMIDTYQQLIFSVCYKITNDYFAAEDLSQETFLTAYQKYGSFDGLNEKAWICRIATNKSIDYVRGAGRRQIPTQDDFFHGQEEKHWQPEQTCIENEVKRQISEYCRQLKPPYDEIARAFYLEEKSAAEIAEQRCVNLKTIRTQIYRARNMLRGMYGKEMAE